MNFAAIVLAAGSASRFGGDKLSAPFAGEPLLHHAIRAARAAPVARVIVVTRPGLALGDWPVEPPVEAVTLVSKALSDSLKAGVAAVMDCDGAFVFLGDMPLVPHAIAADLAANLGEAYAAMPRQGERPGHPVLLSRRALSDIAQLSGDEGAGRLLRSHSDVAFVACDSPFIHADVDRPEDLSRLAPGDGQDLAQ